MTGQRIATPLPFSLLACVALVDGCQHPAPPSPTPDAALTADAGNARATRGRRRRNRPGAPAAPGNVASRTSPSGSTGSAGSDNQGDDLGVDDPGPEAPAPTQRPRITEHGPILPENVERPAGSSVEFDMTAGAPSGPMGLEPAQISAALNPLLGRLQVCAAATTDDQGHGPRGHVAVRLRIHNDGNPVAARVTGGSGPAEFLPCVRRVVASARFAHFAGPEVLASWGFDL